jgi:hypothetical protein
MGMCCSGEEELRMTLYVRDPQHSCQIFAAKPKLPPLIKLVAVSQSHGGSATERPGGQIEQQLQEVDRLGTRSIAPRLKPSLSAIGQRPTSPSMRVL